MRSFREEEEEATSEELFTMGRGPEEPRGSCSPEDQIQSVSMGLPTGQERTGSAEAEATVSEGAEAHRILMSTCLSIQYISESSMPTGLTWVPWHCSLGPLG